MSKDSRGILLKYWGYSAFRPQQEEIIDTVASGNDCLALLPTGGGKSICFQVPAMMLDGMCIVVTPLIALMKDQVQHLKRLGIPAAAIYSGMHFNELEIVYNQSVFGQLKFLYVSPERLIVERFIDAVKRMKISLIAVDESHCISQWGYDFRPPYLRIAEIRQYLPKVPILALTATATPGVVEDIQEKLKFRTKKVLQTSYERKNLTYNVVYQPDKFGSLLRLAGLLKAGSGIVYVRNRKRTREMADYLSSRGISATYYHAGLDQKTRDIRQASWMKGEHRIIVATNAFGMGIDKPDVRLVVHLDLPDSLEAYFQEAGRAGRDGNESAAYMICNDNDVHQLKANLESSYPEPAQIKAIYEGLGNYFQIPVGGGKDQSFNFDIATFSKQYNFPVIEVYNTLRLLEKEGMLMLSESFHAPSKLLFSANREDLYRFQVEQPAYDGFIKFLLRNYPGLFTDFVVINEEEVAKKLNSDVERVGQMLLNLQKMGFLTYTSRKDKPQLIFLSERQATSGLYLSREHYADRKVAAARRVQSVIDFISNQDVCRSVQLLVYFGETNPRRCGKCDVCKKRNSLALTDVEYNHISSRLRALLSERPYPVFEVIKNIEGFSEEKSLAAIRWMIDNKILEKDGDERLSYVKQMGIGYIS